MRYDAVFRNPGNAEQVIRQMADRLTGRDPVRLMEICGTHTMAIARTGLRSLLPERVKLLSGPGCPVCVTPAGVMDEILELSSRPGIRIASYGDLLRVPGSTPGDCLLRRKAMGALTEAVYSPMDAIALAELNPEEEVVFLGVGFETTAPGTAACIREAARKGLRNFSVLCLLKQTEPALRALIEAPDFHVDGFLCPGHVAAITGAEAFRFLLEEYGLPAVISGFEAGDLLYSVSELIRMVSEGRPELKNEYIRLVKPRGNELAKKGAEMVFEPCCSLWRGIGELPEGGLAIRREYEAWDAAHKFGLSLRAGRELPGCCCGEVIRGGKNPWECPLFGKRCTPSDPVGPCMVSGEGACAAAWRYRLWENGD